MNEKIGEFSEAVITALELHIPIGTGIFTGKSNRLHMEKQHSRDFKKYYYRIDCIIADPDYVGFNRADGSIEFIKTFKNHVKVAVRVANDDVYYARSLYEVGTSRIDNSVKRGELKKLLTKE